MLFSKNLNLFNHSAQTNVTDRQTERRTDRQTDRITMAIARFALKCIVR